MEKGQKKAYVLPEYEIILLQTANVITTSVAPPGGEEWQGPWA